MSYDDEKLYKITKEAEKKNKKDVIEDFQIFPSLKNVNLNVKPGEFVGIIGKVGSGKSTLLKAIMKQLFMNEGKIKKNGRIGYIP